MTTRLGNAVGQSTRSMCAAHHASNAVPTSAAVPRRGYLRSNGITPRECVDVTHCNNPNAQSVARTINAATAPPSQAVPEMALGTWLNCRWLNENYRWYPSPELCY